MANKITSLQAALESWLAPMLTVNGGPALTIESLFFVNPQDAGDVMERFKEKAPGVFLSYPQETYQGANKSVPSVGGRCAEMTTLTYSLFIVYTDRDDQDGKAEFIYAARDRLFNSISSREFSAVSVTDADGNVAKATVLDMIDAQTIDTPEMIVWGARFRVQMSERAVGY